MSSSSTNLSNHRTVCHLCGHLGQTKFLSIDKNGYEFLRHLPPAPGALPIDDHTSNVRACHLCILLLDKQKELNHTTKSFFFKGFFRSTGSCHTDSPEEQDISSAEPIQNRSLPPPLRITNELSSLDSFLKSTRSHFQSEYTSLLSSSKILSYDSCQLCSSIKPRGTLYSLSKKQYEFLHSSQIDVCTLCYLNFVDQYKKQVKPPYRRPHPQCYLCRNRLTFVDWEIKFLDTEYLPFLLNLPNHDEQLYDNQRLALTCDQCFYTILFQYIDQEREHIPQHKRTYTWQCTYSYENEQYFRQANELFL